MSNPDVIFVDDEEDLRRAARQSLDLADLSVRCFPDARAALERIGRDMTSVLVTDIRMTGMDGLELLRRVRSEAPTHHYTLFNDVTCADSHVNKLG